jgi:MFS family permease
VAVFLGALDQTVVVTALPAIVEDLRIPLNRLDQAAWIVSAYLLGYTVAMPLVGRMSDVHGRQRSLVACLALLGLTSVWCATTRSLDGLIVGRGLQAIGGGAMLPIALGVVGTRGSVGQRVVGLGVVSAIAEAGGVLGPLWGALILGRADWPWVFWANVPVVIALVLVLRAARPVWSSSHQGRVDYVGAGLLGAGLGGVALALSRETPGGLLVRLAVGAGAVALLIALLVWEPRVREPLIDPRVFLSRRIAAASILSLLSGVALIVAMVDVPLYSATVLQRSPVEGGLLLMRMMALIPVGAVLGGLATRRLGPAVSASGGVAMSGAALALLAGWRPETTDLEMSAHLALGGLGFGLQLAPISSTVVAAAGASRAGVASALAVVMRTIGMLIGVASLTSWGLDRFNTLVADIPFPSEASAEKLAAFQSALLAAALTVFSEVFLAAAIVCAIALVPALLLRAASRASD